MYNEPALRKLKIGRTQHPLSFEGIWVRPRNTTVSRTSTTVMETFKTHLDHDVIATALVVVPASLGWVFFNHLGSGVLVGLSSYLAYDYGYSLLRYREIDIRALPQLFVQTCDTIRSRAKKHV